MDETTIFGWVIKHILPVFIPLASVFGWVWKKQDSRIDRIENAMYTREDAAERLKSVDKTLEDRRQDVKDIYDTIAERGRINEQRHEKTNDMIRELTRDMSKGFSDIKDLLLGGKK